MGSAYLFNGLFFSLPWFYRSGYDVVLYTLPFHAAAPSSTPRSAGTASSRTGSRASARRWRRPCTTSAPYSTISSTPGVDRIALTGMSLGGYTAALLASVDDRIQAVIPNVPS